MRRLMLYMKDDDASWTETYIEGEEKSFRVGLPDDAVMLWGAELVDRFNRTRQPNEKERHIIESVVEKHDGPVKLAHNWAKTNLVTIMKGGMSYDRYKCETCGVTGKRYGIGAWPPERDPKFKAEKYACCILPDAKPEPATEVTEEKAPPAKPEAAGATKAPKPKPVLSEARQASLLKAREALAAKRKAPSTDSKPQEGQP